MIFRFDGIDFYGTEATGVVFKGDNDIDDDDDGPKMMSTFHILTKLAAAAGCY